VSYQLTHINNIDFIKKHYSDQIEALISFYQETSMKSMPKGSIKFGGGTALAMYYFQHRLSFDIDLFVNDIQYMDYLRPKMWIEETAKLWYTCY
jgi:hypothetical protein